MSHQEYLLVESILAKGSDNKVISEFSLLDQPARDAVGLKRGFDQFGNPVNTFLVMATTLNQHHLFKEIEYIGSMFFNEMYQAIIDCHCLAVGGH